MSRAGRLHKARGAAVRAVAARGFAEAEIATLLNLPARMVREHLHGPQDAAAQRRAERNARKRTQVDDIRNGRRFTEPPVPTGKPANMAPPDARGTLAPQTVLDPVQAGDEPILKCGGMNSKIGARVLTGRLRGAKIVTLTLEERATCPTSCGHWRTCYGNGMPRARRWRHGPELEMRVAREIHGLCTQEDLVLVRLHVLGDFYSERYVALWAALLERHPNLYVFGFTAHGPATPIGRLIADGRAVFGDRWSIRHSGRSGPWGSWTVDYPTEKPRMGDGIVCPEQRLAISDPEQSMHCGACGICWQSSAPIIFIEH